MIPVATKATEFDSLPGEEVEFSIGDPRWVMRSLSDLYSVREKAVAREYSTNAWDAHVEAGNTDPIQVTLPTIYNPFFEVQDFGVGMSLEDLQTTYTEFGTSTKRNSDAENGMLGFGSKSAIAYTNTFTVTSVKDGVKNQAVITRKPDYSVVLKVVMTSKTDEPNGTKVSVPVHNPDAFARIARDFYRFWLPGTVLVDGEQPEWAVGEKLDDNLYYSTSPGVSYVVMGNVAYRIANPAALFTSSKMNSMSFVMYVPMGSVEFSNSREDLKYTDHTKATLHKVIADFETKVTAKAKADIATADSYSTAYEKWSYWTKKLGSRIFGDLEFKGEKFVDKFDIQGQRADLRANAYVMSRVNAWSIGLMHTTLVVTGFIPQQVAYRHRHQAREYLALKGLTAQYVVFTDMNKIESVWVDPKRVIDYEQLKAETKKVRPRTPRPSRGAGLFDYETKDGWSRGVLPGEPKYYICVQKYKSVHVKKVLTHFQDDGIVVILPANRINKFKRDHPKMRSFVDVFTSKVQLDGTKLLDADAREALGVGYNTKRWLDVLPVGELDDPEFKRIRDLVRTHENKKLTEYEAAWDLAKAMGRGTEFIRHGLYPHDDSLIHKYPLLSGLPFRSTDRHELALYLNAKYAELRKGNK